MKDELPESFKKGLEAMEKDRQKTTPSAEKEATPTEKSKKETTPTQDKDKVLITFTIIQLIRFFKGCALNKISSVHVYSIEDLVKNHH